MLRLLAVQNELMSLEDLSGEVRTVRKKLLEVNTGIVIQKHTSNSWSVFVTEGGLNVAVDAVSYEFVFSCTLKVIERSDINWLREVNHLHLWCCWLLLLHLLLVNLSLWLLWLRHAWLPHVLSLVVIVTLVLSLVIVLAGLVVFIVVTTSSSATSVASSIASVVVLSSSVAVSHVLIRIASLVRLHLWHLLHLVDIPVLLLLNIDKLNDVLN